MAFSCPACPDRERHTKAENLHFFLYLTLIKPLLVLEFQCLNFQRSWKRSEKKHRKPINRLKEKTSEKKLKMGTWLHLENCRPKADLITFFEKRTGFLWRKMLAGFSPTLKSWKPDKIGLESNKKIVSDLRQNAAAAVIELCHCPPWRALKMCSTTASSGQSRELAGEGHSYQLCVSMYS